MNRSLPSAVNLTPALAYDCQVKDAQGNLLGRLAWTPGSPGTLTIAGTIFFDGNIAFSNSVERRLRRAGDDLRRRARSRLSNSIDCCAASPAATRTGTRRRTCSPSSRAARPTPSASRSRTARSSRARSTPSTTTPSRPAPTIWGPIIARQVSLCEQHDEPLRAARDAPARACRRPRRKRSRSSNSPAPGARVVNARARLDRPIERADESCTRCPRFAPGLALGQLPERRRCSRAAAAGRSCSPARPACRARRRSPGTTTSRSSRISCCGAAAGTAATRIGLHLPGRGARLRAARRRPACSRSD